ncbi:ribonuclease E [Caulobacter ginsengisoli]|uniref:Ribonuclease E n=1 Tax=Caulobacter ginsengisoli TaxID=400775 RepID=A0ABU0IPI1_9CAUL|nr:ribonuclease E/G [Caulobacter ginsengisoli]MDQ0462872.1 ribonuclease E [Caulobacter ginsengisoli]
MTKRMLIDAAHPEETRVVVIDGTRVEDFDFESQNRKQLRGNIYLAKVTRVEPSLQAAFIEYGGNRHGFLAFNEIHPDYYQIPVADREALMREALEDDEDERPARGRGRGNGRSRAAAVEAPPEAVLEGEEISESEAAENAQHHEDEDDAPRRSAPSDDDDDMEEEVERRRRRLMRKYKIQEVIRRRQIMLVQVVKEERGNKGAALTTYLSLAGRYGVLMPNTDRGGGISRKIEAATDRKRLKTVVQSLAVPKGMGLIVRTAGAKRTKVEIKRDYDYLLRLWENIRETTLHSIAPALIYEEEDLVKRAIRDLFDKDIDGVFVEGEAGFREARDFMRMLMPSQAKKVQPYREATPLFVAHKVENHLSQIYSPNVPLRSGGYLVINQTEALVAIDVNSGRATRERNIEATALKTNMEAAEEAARQLRLRDLAGLIVIDFIDMEESKNNRAVEKKFKDSIKDDRARIQMGRISGFGLLEISRQRRRSGVLEATTHVCEHCQGQGRVRSTESSALAALRAVEMEALQGGGEVTLKVPRDVGLYILNEKRAYLARVHQAHGLYVTVVVDDHLEHVAHEIDRTVSGERSLHPVEALPALAKVSYDPADDADMDVEDDVDADEDEEAIEVLEDDGDQTEPRESHDREPREAREGRDFKDDGGDRNGRRGRRRRGRGPRREDGPAEIDAGAEARAPSPANDEDAEGDDEAGRRRRRGRRGGRRGRDETKPADGFHWTRPRVPFDNDVFVWHDPANLEGGGGPRTERTERPERTEAPEAAERAERPERPERAEGEGSRRRGRGRGRGDPRPVLEPSAEAPVAEALVEAPLTEPVSSAPPADIWVELPAPDEAAPKKRRSRAKAKPAAEEALIEAAAPQAVLETAPEPVIEAAPEPEPAPEPVAAPKPAPEPVAVVPDPAEILAPPEKPKKGWWRR